MHYHITVFGQYSGVWQDAEQQYRQLMRDPENVNFITIVREPRSHLLRYLVYLVYAVGLVVVMYVMCVLSSHSLWTRTYLRAHTSRG